MFLHIGFPHSEIFGSTFVGNSPKLIAAYHVLHRLSAPRHPPFTLSSLTKIFSATKMPFRFTLFLFSKNVPVFTRYLSPVEKTGFEPATFAVQGRRSPS